MITKKDVKRERKRKDLNPWAYAFHSSRMRISTVVPELIKAHNDLYTMYYDPSVVIKGDEDRKIVKDKMEQLDKYIIDLIEFAVDLDDLKTKMNNRL